ncbi:MAG: FtsX-like permease family protein, partial [Gammaproteobacteria bacterium]
IILGSELANALQTFPGDRLVIMTTQGTVTPAGIAPRLRRFKVTGLFEVGMYEYDRSLALIHMHDASRLFGMGEEISGVRLKVQDLFQANRVVREVAYSLGDDTYFISDWTRQHTNLYRALKMEKRIMSVILFLIVTVAMFNIISTLVMVVTDKQADIAILRTLGASPRSIMAVFMVQGTVIGIMGALLGVSLGVLLALNVEIIVPFIEQSLGIEFLPGDVYYISDLPSDLQLTDVVITTVGSFLLALLSTIYPALRAAATQPAEALRYE